MSVERTRPSSTVVLLIDIQEGPMSGIAAERRAAVERAAALLLRAAAELRAPIIVTEQDPDDLGHVIRPLARWLRDAGVRAVEKSAFSACNEPAFLAELKRTDADAAIVVGLEAHVSVFQTVRDLVGRGLRVHVPVDGVGSRRADHREAGLRLCERAGAVLTTSETILFDWLVQSGTDSFHKLAPLTR